MELRNPIPSDFIELSSWIPDAAFCLLWAGPNISFPFSPEELEAQLQSPDGSKSYCLYEDEQPIGFGQFWPRGEETIHLGRIIISPLQRGVGNGTSLLQLLLERATEENPTYITLRVFRANQIAIQLYEKMGFITVDHESNKNALIMKKAASQQRPF